MNIESIENALEGLTYELMLYREEIMKKENLSFTGFFVLSTLSKGGRMKSSDLALRLGVTKPSISHIIDNLESKGLVIRQYGMDDRRAIYIDLSVKGKLMLEKLYNVKSMALKAMGEMDQQTIEGFLQFVNMLAKNVHEIRERSD
ncbi:MarR family winged helix-turn-helix transcriptional regulator [Cuniculiplasma divulgatum]|uniref:MarR family transcriptional regulator n=1 Tax=Cuniculiplasma divulgatum TaxID=1673428 RepID=A0A1N5UHQ6_9ARCH|nr:MarR family transcriptional regulator [Cuniculiplasma divulgatum]EQB69954.1 MAG: YwaE [Thermoplasmatales archaeon Gpl]MCI2411883.1 MarR family transcriptional regulator [Cuniculiplasma sp.]MCL4320690.1 MarR family transcriptional regulator [Candidatus Thermoplasmatota archaeon]WMT49071.1 MAG: MarR family transcriptional regulator [Thermoplasmatales archaeon]SIM59758.1 MarR family transcriptional regulator [Cuniculiplasma divulgatum]